jgi:cellulose biosynthesis protein BcsQ
MEEEFQTCTKEFQGLSIEEVKQNEMECEESSMQTIFTIQAIDKQSGSSLITMLICKEILSKYEVLLIDMSSGEGLYHEIFGEFINPKFKANYHSLYDFIENMLATKDLNTFSRLYNSYHKNSNKQEVIRNATLYTFGNLHYLPGDLEYNFIPKSEKAEGIEVTINFIKDLAINQRCSIVVIIVPDIYNSHTRNIINIADYYIPIFNKISRSDKILIITALLREDEAYYEDLMHYRKCKIPCIIINKNGRDIQQPGNLKLMRKFLHDTCKELTFIDEYKNPLDRKDKIVLRLMTIPLFRDLFSKDD